MEDIKYVGRNTSAATATGFYSVHLKEQVNLVEKALQSDPINYPYWIAPLSNQRAREICDEIIIGYRFDGIYLC